MGDTTVATIIYNQLGGNRFRAMTGAKDFIASQNALTMTLPRNASKANRLRITLRPDDTYTMEFIRYSSPRYYSLSGKYSEAKVTVIQQYDGVYADSLQQIFTNYTKLYTHL